MTQTLMIATPFNDMSELAENFANRVDETPQMFLPYPEPVAEGEWVSFVVQLADSSVALAGTGRVIGNSDNGEEYPPEYRYEVAVDSLTFEGTSEVMFERILVARESMVAGDPGTGEVDLGEHEAALAKSPSLPPGPASVPPARAPLSEVPSAFGDDEPEEATAYIPAAAMEKQQAYEAEALEAVGAEEQLDDAAEHADPPSAEAWGDDDAFETQEPTRAGSIEELRAPMGRPSAPPPPPGAARAVPRGAPQRAPGTLPLLHGFENGILTRPSLEPSWAPGMIPRPEAAQSSGLFDFGGPIPRPAAPPRPDILDEVRVAPAPSPSMPWSRMPEEAQEMPAEG